MSDTIKFTVTAVALEIKGVKNAVTFKIVHNMSSNDFNIALQSWVVRTGMYKAKDFVDYCNSKKTGHIIMTEERYNELFNDKEERPRRNTRSGKEGKRRDLGKEKRSKPS